MTSTARVRGAAAAVPRTLRSPPVDVRLAVVAAHRTGFPLHGQLVALGARFAEVTMTAPAYRLVALPGPGVPRGGIVPVGAGGHAIEVELHELPAAALGGLLALLPAPLAIGRVELATGSELGILCTTVPPGARDVSAFGSWPGYLAAAAR